METTNRFNTPSFLNRFKLAEKSISLMVVIGIVIIVILGIVVVGAAINLQSDPTQSPIARVPTPTSVPRTEMWLDPSSTTVPANRQFNIDIVIDARNRVIYGSDAIINYDPDYLRVISVSGSNDPDSEFDMYDRQTDGQIQITSVKLRGTNNPTSQMILATITFQSVQSGTTNLTFEFKPATTSNSTIIQARDSENILDLVRGARIQIE